MRLLKLNELLRPQDLHMIRECENRKTYDWLYLNVLLSYFDYQYSIVDIIRLNGPRKKYDLIKIEPYKSYNVRYRKFLTDKNVSQRVVRHYIKKLFPNVEIKTITRQYKYAPEIKNTYLTLRSN